MQRDRSEQIHQELNDALNEIQQALNAMQKAVAQETENLNASGGQKRQDSLSLNFAKKLASKLTSVKRLLLLYADGQKMDRKDVLALLHGPRNSDCSNIELQINQDAVLLRLPYLPHRSSKDSLLFQALAYKLHRAKDIPKWRSCHIDFMHVYPTSTLMIPRDNDNYAYKRPIDLITFAFGCADHPLCFDYSAYTIITDEYAPGTYIGICPKSSENSILRLWKNQESAKLLLEKSQPKNKNL